MRPKLPIAVHQDAKSWHRTRTIVPVSMGAMPRIIRSALAESGWHRTGGDDSLGTLTADLKRSSREGPMHFTDDFQLIVNWFKSGPRVELGFSVSDLVRRNNAIECKRRSDLFLALLRSKTEQFTSMPAEELDPRIYPLAKFADTAKLQKKGLFEVKNDPDQAKRFRLGHFENKTVSLTPSQSEMHQLVCGPTRSGKTTGLFIPNLIERVNTSAIVTEATAGDEPPDLYFKTAGYRAKHGHAIYYFNPDDMYSDRVNPLDQIEIGAMTGRQIGSVAELIMRTTTQDRHVGDQYWTQSEQFLLKSLLWHAVGERAKGNGHLGYICELLQFTPDELKIVMSQSRMIKARELFASFISKGSEDTRNIVMGALLQRLDLWTEPVTVALTNATTVDVAALSEQLFTFYIAMPGHKLELQPLATLLFNWVLQIALEKKFKHPLTLLLDEFTNFGFIAGMDRKLTTIGHRKIPICMGIQDAAQLRTTYKEFADIFRTQPGTRIFFRPRDGEVAKRISEDLGITTVVDYEPSGAESMSRKMQRQLLSPDQLQSLEDRCIVFLPTGGAAQIDFHKPDEYDWATKIPPPPRTKIEIPDTQLFVQEEEESEEEGQEESAEHSSYQIAEESEDATEAIENPSDDLSIQLKDLAAFISEKLTEARRLAALGRTDEAQILYQQALQAEKLMNHVRAAAGAPQTPCHSERPKGAKNLVPDDPPPDEPQQARKKRPDVWLLDDQHPGEHHK